MTTIIPTDLPLPEGPEPRAMAPAASPIPDRRALSADGGGRSAVEPRHRATGPIGAKERQHLARLAREAWDKCGARAAGVPCDEWRHDQVQDATGGRADGLTSLARGQYREVLAHFLSIAGHGGRAMRQATRSGQGAADRELAIAKLRDVCEGGGLAWPAYPESICRRQFRCGLDELETGKIWFLFYTCTSRARAKSKKRPEIDSEGGIGKSAVSTLESPGDAQDPTGEGGERHF